MLNKLNRLFAGSELMRPVSRLKWGTVALVAAIAFMRMTCYLVLDSLIKTRCVTCHVTCHVVSPFNSPFHLSCHVTLDPSTSPLLGMRFTTMSRTTRLLAIDLESF